MHGEQSSTLKAEHKIVLEALEAANIALGRVVTVTEIVKAVLISKASVNKLNKRCAHGLNITVSKVTAQLLARNIIFSPGKIGKERYFGSVDALAPERRGLPTFVTRRQRVLALVRAAVALLKRAVRIGDILDYATGRPEAEGLTPIEITHDVLSLKETGELQVIDSPLRKDERGSQFYLPSELDPANYRVIGPVTWLDQVAQAFNELWNERKAEAEASGRLPRPVSTGEVRHKLNTRPEKHSNLENTQLLINALIQLASTDAATIRKVKRPGQKASLWAPLDVSDEMLDVGNAFASDGERVGAALQRAVNRFGRPVNQREVADEIRMDATLQPAQSSDLFEILSDAAKETVGDGNGNRQARKIRRVYRVGRLNGSTYYHYLPDAVPDAKFYMRLQQLESLWSEAHVEEEIEALNDCLLPSVTIGRAMLLAKNTEDVAQALRRLLDNKHGNRSTRETAEELLGRADSACNRIHEWLASYDLQSLNLPSTVDPTVPTWTAQELHQAYLPLYPQAQESTDPHWIIRLFHDKIRRVRNHDFQDRFSKEHNEAAEFFFDRTDALLYAAIRWGGRDCSFQAMMARNLLGRLRDVRFILPALELDSFELRSMGVACLAFLQTAVGKERLRRLATEDVSSAVRETAIWACGFAGIEGLKTLLSRLSKDDPDPQVRALAQKGLSTDSWWFM